MTVEIDLRSRLVQDAAIAAIVATRVFWKLRTQSSALPAIVLGTVFGARSQSFDGPMGTQGNRIQFDCLATSKEAAVTLRRAVLDVIESPSSVGETEFQGGFVNLYRDSIDETVSGVVHTETIDATVWFN